MFKKNIKKSEIISPRLSNKEKLDAAKQNNKAEKDKLKRKNIKLYIILTIILILTLIIAEFTINYLNTKKYEPYIKYEEKMKTYGFDKIYDNKSAKTNESVTKSEAIRLAIAAAFNTNDISGFAAEHNEYGNAIWTEYAQDTGVVNEDINSSNFNDKVKYKDVISYFENCKFKFLTDQVVKDNAVNLKDIAKYTASEQTAIKDMISYEIINLTSKKLNGNNNIFKGQLNEIVVNFVEKYNTIVMPGDKINVNPDKIPSNAELYPYTLATVDKTVYEKPLMKNYDVRFENAKEVYASIKDMYPQVKEHTEEYFNIILNIDYRTITEENLTQKLEPYYIFAPNQSVVKSYVKHVKDNEIIIEGNSKLQVPIIYFDGVSYRARVELKFDIKNSKTKENVLYLDRFDALKKTYEKTNYDIFVDCSLSNAIGSKNMYLNQSELYNSILDKDKCGITKQVDTESYVLKEEKNNE